MRFEIFSKLLLIFSFLFLSSCLGLETEPKPTPAPPVEATISHIPASANHHTFDPEIWEAVAIPEGMVKKVDNFMIIHDNSASMTEKHYTSSECLNCHKPFSELDYVKNHISVNGSDKDYEEKNIIGDKENITRSCLTCHSDYAYTKEQYAKKITTFFNQSIPDLELISALRVFGAPVYTKLIAGKAPYVKDHYNMAIRKIEDANGASPLDHSFNAIEKDWFDSEGKIAIILVSDGKGMAERDVIAAQKFKIRYGDRVCIYTIQIGNDINGKKILSRIAKVGECGLAVHGDTLMDRNKMEEFITEIFLTKGKPRDNRGLAASSALDSDGDGVPDFKDDCPGTLPGLEVDENGCWKLTVLADVLFDFDKYNLKPEGIKVLDQVVKLLNKHPSLKLHMGGHTDNKGSMQYNIKLSKRRVTSGLNYLKKQGVNSKRITISWHSYSIPRATNETKEGRALNRRIEFKFKK